MSELNKIAEARKPQYIEKITVATAYFAENLPTPPEDNRTDEQLVRAVAARYETPAVRELMEKTYGHSMELPYAGEDALAGYLVAWVPIQERKNTVYQEGAKFLGQFEYGTTYLNVTSAGRVRDGSKDFLVVLGSKPRFSNLDVRPATDAEIAALVDKFIANRPASFVRMFDNDGDSIKE
jgi:hypothetical protein